MKSAEGAATLEELALSGIHRDLTMLAAKGLVPLPIQELVSLQIKLLDFDDEVVQAEAGKALRECDPSILHVLIAETSDVDLVSRVVAEIDHPLIIEAALRRSGPRSRSL